MEAFIETVHPLGATFVERERAQAVPLQAPPATRVRPLSLGSWPGTIAAFLVADAAALLFSFGVNQLAAGALFESSRNVLASELPVFLLLPVAYALSGLYVGAVVHPAEEMRRISRVTTMVFAVMAGTLALLQGVSLSLGLLLALTWGVTTVTVTVTRIVSRILLARTSWWGFPVVVVGQGFSGAAVIKSLRRWPELGLRPIALVDDALDAVDVEDVPVCGTAADAPALALDYKAPYAVLAMPDLSHRKQAEMAARLSKFYDRVLIVPEIDSTQMLWNSSRYFQGVLGYDIQHNHRKLMTLVVKRLMDFAGALLGIVLLAPLFAAVALLIKLDSRGPVFYRQVRMGRGGRSFNVLKFRSMHGDADHKLEQILREHPELRAEYAEFKKLREDPRITRMGKVLRRFSLDELPQLINVLKGEMSLVGPRAYLPKELACMDNMEPVILQNKPGLTGLWQVSGRNNLSFEERVNLDVHYIQNWSIWLDTYIFVRTIPVVLAGEGAC